jgi:hypothetical protein
MLTADDTIYLQSDLATINVDLIIQGQTCQNPTISGTSTAYYYPVFYGPSRSLTFTNVNIINCIDNGWGEGGAINGNDVTLTNCYFYNNTVTVSTLGGACDGGAVFSNQSVTAYNCTFNNNQSTSGSTEADGGAIAAGGSSFYLTNCTFVNNQATSYGSAIWGIPHTVYNCTFVNNITGQGGIIWSNVNLPVSFANNIVWGNTGSNKPALYFPASSSYDGSNILQQAGEDTLYVAAPGDTFGVDPQLGTLGYYGGCVPTMPIKCGSIAENYGTTFTIPMVDSSANGDTAYGIRDAGAFEVVPMSIAITTTGSADSNGTAAVSNTGGVAPYHYLWSNSQTTDTIRGLTPGTYMVTVTDLAGCPLADTVTVISTGINDIAGLKRFEVFPNPANNNVNIQLQNSSGNPLHLRITDIEGKSFYNMPIGHAENWNKTLDLSLFSSGVYYIEITGVNGSESKTLVIVH